MTVQVEDIAMEEDSLSKRALLSFVNRILDLHVARLEQCANGAIYCQLIDSCAPSVVPMHKVNFSAKEEHDIWANYKVLQAAFVALEITKHIDVPRLSKGYAADNLELLQWLFKFLRRKPPIVGYQAKQRRLLRKGASATEEIPVPSCLAANFEFRKLNESQSPNSPNQPGNGKGRVWSSRDIIGGKVDVSHVVSRYKEGLLAPVLVAKAKQRVGSMALPEQVYEDVTPPKGQSTNSFSTQTDDLEGPGSASGEREVASRGTAMSMSDGAGEGVGEVGPRGLGHALDAASEAAAHGPQAESPSGRPRTSETGAAYPLLASVSTDLEPDSRNSPATSSGGDQLRHRRHHDLPPDAVALLYMSALANSGYLPFHGTEVLSDALSTAQDALEEVQNVVPRLQQQQQEGARASAPCSLVCRGKLRSLLVATRTLLQHMALLLSDVAAQCSDLGDVATPGGGASSGGGGGDHSDDSTSQQAPLTAAVAAERAAALTQLLGSLQAAFDEISAKLQVQCNAAGIQDEPSPADLSAGTGELLCTTQLDVVVKAVGQAQFALMQAIHKQAAALAAGFLASPAEDGADDAAAAGTSGRPATGSSRSTRCFRLGGGLQLKKLRNGDVYRGHYSSGKKNGEGVYVFLNHDVYEGEFKADRMDGYGVYTFSHEGRYEGQWQSAVYSGYGTETFSKGSTYYGQYSAGLRNGCGACRFFNGDYYEGSWANGLRDGQGMQQCTDDSNYVGEYVKGKRHGYGVYSFPNGDRYQGEYADDLPHGHGVYLFASGQKYEGEWSQGKKHGWSIYTVDNGQQFVGQWLDSKPQWIQALTSDVSSVDGASAQASLLHEDLDQAAAAGATEEVPDEIQQLATTARTKAKEAAHAALLCAEHHWTHTSPMGVSTSVSGAAQAAAQAQAARSRAMGVAMKLNLAVAIQQQPVK